MYLLETLRRGDSNKNPKSMFSQRITLDCQGKNADRINVVRNLAVITKAVIKRVHCILKIYIQEWIGASR